MKAVSYLKLENMNEMFYFLKNLGWKLGIKDFYNQKFQPGMILKYFEAWADWEIDTYFSKYIAPSQEDRVPDGQFLSNPITLDNFILDCERVGIDLYWKENIDIKKKEKN